jgi:hypothetical protein
MIAFSSARFLAYFATSFVRRFSRLTIDTFAIVIP